MPGEDEAGRGCRTGARWQPDSSVCGCTDGRDGRIRWLRPREEPVAAGSRHDRGVAQERRGGRLGVVRGGRGGRRWRDGGGCPDVKVEEGGDGGAHA